jgi:DNA-binding CsgD family transcriptional regulator
MDPATRIASLSSRELQIARAYAAGNGYRTIAERLFIAPSTVRTHLSTIYRKLGSILEGRLAAGAGQECRT